MGPDLPQPKLYAYFEDDGATLITAYLEGVAMGASCVARSTSHTPFCSLNVAIPLFPTSVVVLLAGKWRV